MIVVVRDAAMRQRWLIAIPKSYGDQHQAKRVYDARIMLNCCHLDELSM